jgi:hypothetical protein
VAGWDERERKDRALWKTLLKVEALCIKETPGEQPVADADIDEVVQRTTMLPVYPMLHLSAMLNRSARPADAAKADEHSGILRLIGSIEALNYEALLDDVARLCQRALPQFVSSLRDTLEDAKCKLPQELVDLANTMLKGKRKNEAFTLKIGELKREVEQEFNAARGTLRENMSAFLRTDESIYAPLHGARVDQQGGWQALKRKMDTFHGAYNVINPRHSGMLRNYELMHVAFPAANVGGALAYGALCHEIENTLEELGATVVALVVAKVQLLLHESKSEGVSTASAQQLLQTVYQHQIDGPLKDRAGAFFSTKQKPIDLQQNRPAEHFLKIVLKVRV